jgi:hypothetical protein
LLRDQPAAAQRARIETADLPLPNEESGFLDLNCLHGSNDQVRSRDECPGLHRSDLPGEPMNQSNHPVLASRFPRVSGDMGIKASDRF